MKECRRCHEGALDVARQSTVRRGRRQYVLYWYRCRSCLDVSFRYRTLPDVDAWSVADASRTEEREGADAIVPLDPALLH